MSTHNLCFGTKIRKMVIPCKLQFYYIKVSIHYTEYSLHGVFITRTCFPDGTTVCFVSNVLSCQVNIKDHVHVNFVMNVNVASA